MKIEERLDIIETRLEMLLDFIENDHKQTHERLKRLEISRCGP